MRHELWPLACGLLILIGLLTSSGLLLIVGSLVAVVWLAARLWERQGFRKVTYSRGLGQRRAFIGDTLEYTVVLTNDKPLPLIWVEAQDPFPEGLELSGAVVRGATLETNRHHSITTSLLPYQRATWKFPMRCTRRGYHRIGPVRMRSGDIFGFSSTETRRTDVENLLVYPRIVDIEGMLTPPQNPFGLTRGRLPLYQDTNRVKGQREYSSVDPMKHIDWKATARVGMLQTKIFDPAVSMNLVVAMNGSTSDYVWQGTNRRLFERAVTAAASTVSAANRLGYTFGLISNAVASYSGKWLSVPPGAATSQLALTLEALAMAAPYVVAMLPDVFRAERDRLPLGATVIYVTAAITPSVPRQVREISERGFRVLVLYAGDGEPPESVEEFPVTGIAHLLDELPESEDACEGEPERGGIGTPNGAVLEVPGDNGGRALPRE